MNRSLIARAAIGSLFSAVGPLLLGVAAAIWLMLPTGTMVNERGWRVLSPLVWINEVSRATPDDKQWMGVLFGIAIWLLLSAFLVVAPAVALIVAIRQGARRVRRGITLRRFDPDAAPDLVLVAQQPNNWMASRISGNSQRVAILGVLERIVPDSGLAAALAGETTVALLGDRTRMPAVISTRLDGYLLNRSSRSSAVIVVDRTNNECWLMGRMVPQSALVPDPSGLLPRTHRSREVGTASLTVGGGAALVWADDNGGWAESDGGWGDGGSDGGGGGDGGSGGGGDGGGGDGGGGGGGGGGE
ncbi:hypothetical protein [Gordonia aurantiaca]|uniref:hypothetical protein n=1 Tax=Gordonia sp. B21 TaxID=3151852 RepID=UPI003266F2C3